MTGNVNSNVNSAVTIGAQYQYKLGLRHGASDRTRGLRSRYSIAYDGKLYLDSPAAAMHRQCYVNGYRAAHGVSPITCRAAR